MSEREAKRQVEGEREREHRNGWRLSEQKMRDGRKPRKGEEKKKKKGSEPHRIKNNITLTIDEQCGPKFEIALFINAKNYGIYNV